MERYIKDFGTDPLFSKEKFLKLGIDKGLEYSADLYIKRCTTLVDVARVVYKDYEFALISNDECHMYLTMTEKKTDKTEFIQVHMNSDWKYMKRTIDNTIDKNENKECPLCFEDMKGEIITCSTCSKIYCFDCACNSLKQNKGFAICPFCKVNKGYITNDIEDYKKRYYKYVNNTFEAFKNNQ
tara:strand:+ start:2708 stop:3256 length:549 start_codon:yes stop_codon:yes gene_type:complete